MLPRRRWIRGRSHMAERNRDLAAPKISVVKLKKLILAQSEIFLTSQDSRKTSRLVAPGAHDFKPCYAELGLEILHPSRL